MKIVLTGSHGTGKSSLGKILSQKLNYLLIDNITRKLLKREKLSIVASNDLTFQIKIVSLYLKEFISNDNFVSARCFIDHLAYSRVNNLDKNWIELLNNIIRDWKDRMTVVYIPIEIPLLEDRFRINNGKFQKKIDLEIKKILRDNSIPYLKVSGTLEERSKQVLGALYN